MRGRVFRFLRLSLLSGGSGGAGVGEGVVASVPPRGSLLRFPVRSDGFASHALEFLVLVVVGFCSFFSSQFVVAILRVEAFVFFSIRDCAGRRPRAAQGMRKAGG